MKFNIKTLELLEEILTDSEYIVRYEKGNFKSGWCLLEERKIVILNKFLQTEDKINILLDIIPQLNIKFDKLTYQNQQLFNEILHKKNESVLF